MTRSIPFYVSPVFILTTFSTIGFLFFAIKQKVLNTFPAKLVVTLIAFWLIFQSVLALGGFYLTPEVFTKLPFIIAPAILLIAYLFVFHRIDFIENLPIKILTLLHVIRIPIEIVLWWLYKNEQIPQVMTFEGRNFDILAGITAPIIVWMAFRKNQINRPLLITWNLVSLLLLLNIVITAILSIATPIQQFGFEQPNRAVLYFPYIWLPAIIFPIVLFTHLASIFQLSRKTS